MYIIVKYIKSADRGKPAPSLSTVITGIQQILHHLAFCHKTFTINKGEMGRIKTALDQHCRNGLLIKGRWRARQWITFQHMDRMLEAFLNKQLVSGCGSWDVVTNQLLAMCFMQALDCRAGEINRSQYYTGNECLTWKDIELRVTGNTPLVENIEGTITLVYEKGKK